MYPRNKAITVLTLYGVILLLLTGCASTLQPERIHTADHIDHDSIRSIHMAAEFYIDARYHERKGELDRAYETYRMAWALDSGSAYLTEKLFDMAVERAQPVDAFFFLTKGAPVTKVNDSIARRVIDLFMDFNAYGQAAQIFPQLDTLSHEDSLKYGLSLQNSGRYEKAIEIYRAIYRGDDGTLSIAAELKIAELLARSGRLDEAGDIFISLYETYPEYTPVVKSYALYLLMFPERYDEGMAYLLSLSEEGEISVEENHLLEVISRYLYTKGKHLKAVEVLTPLYFSLVEAGDWDRAVYYGKTVALNLFLGEMEQRAVDLLHALWTRSPKDEDIPMFIGSYYYESGDVDKAVEIYRKTVAQNPEFMLAYRALIGLRFEEEGADSARVESARFKEAFPDHPDPYMIDAHLALTLEKYEEAIDLFRLAHSFGDDDVVGVQFDLAVALERSGQVEEAEAVLQRVLELEPKHHLAANYLGYLWAERGQNLEQARGLIKIALKGDPESGAYLDSYGWVLYQLGLYEDALPYLLKARERVTGDPVVPYHLGRLFIKLGRYKEARSELIEALSYDRVENREEVEDYLKKVEKILKEGPLD